MHDALELCEEERLILGHPIIRELIHNGHISVDKAFSFSRKQNENLDNLKLNLMIEHFLRNNITIDEILKLTLTDDQKYFLESFGVAVSVNSGIITLSQALQLMPQSDSGIKRAQFRSDRIDLAMIINKAIKRLDLHFSDEVSHLISCLFSGVVALDQAIDYAKQQVRCLNHEYQQCVELFDFARKKLQDKYAIKQFSVFNHSKIEADNSILDIKPRR